MTRKCPNLPFTRTLLEPQTYYCRYHIPLFGHGELVKEETETPKSVLHMLRTSVRLLVHSLSATQNLMSQTPVFQDLQKPGGLKKVSEIWSNFAAQDAGCFRLSLQSITAIQDYACMKLFYCSS